METRGFKRRRYLVRTKFQLKYAGLIVILIFIVAFIAGLTIYLTLYPFFYQKLSNVYPQGRLVAVLRLANVRLFFAMLAITPLVVITSIFFSHRIAGPLSRMEMLIDNISKGDLTTQIKLRRKDELISLADSINKMVNSLKEKTGQQISTLSALEISLKELEQQLQSEPLQTEKLRNTLNSLRQQIEAFKQLFSAYKLG